MTLNRTKISQRDRQHGRNGLQDAPHEESEHRISDLTPSEGHGARAMRWPALRQPRTSRPARISSTQRSLVSWIVEFGRVRLQALEPGLIRHHRLVVVEEPHRRLFVEHGVRLLQQLAMLLCRRRRSAPASSIELVEFRVLERDVVAGRLPASPSGSTSAPPAGPGPSSPSRCRPGSRPCGRLPPAPSLSTGLIFTLMPTFSSIGITASTIGMPQLSFWRGGPFELEALRDSLPPRAAFSPSRDRKA